MLYLEVSQSLFAEEDDDVDEIGSSGSSGGEEDDEDDEDEEDDDEEEVDDEEVDDEEEDAGDIGGKTVDTVVHEANSLIRKELGLENNGGGVTVPSGPASAKKRSRYSDVYTPQL